MKTRNIRLDDDGLPDAITIELTRDEAIYLTLLVGRQSGHTANSILPGGDELSPELWRGLSSLFNQFWDDGVKDAAAGR